MPEVSIKVDVESAVNALETVRTEQLPFATALALTRVAQAARDQVKASLRDKYRNRGGSLAFLMQGVRMDPAAKTDLLATVYDVDWFMAYQEEGGTKQATNASMWERIRAAAIADVRFPPSVAAALAQKGSGYFVNQFRNGGWFLGHRYLTGEADQRDIDGTRFGNPGFSVVMLLEKSVEVKPSFGMKETVEGIVGDRFAAVFADAMEHAIATAR